MQTTKNLGLNLQGVEDFADIEKLNENFEKLDSEVGKVGSKMDNKNPTGTGAFCLNRKSGTTVGEYSFAEGINCEASGNYSHAEGDATRAVKRCAHAEGGSTTAGGEYSHAEGNSTTAGGNYSHAEGSCTTAGSNYSHAEGNFTNALGECSHSEGNMTKASANYSHAEGDGSKAKGVYSHAEGSETTASGEASHAEGMFATASGNYSHAEGSSTTASGECSHAEGSSTTASGECSHAGGYNTEARTDYSHAIGCGSIAYTIACFASGKYNTVPDRQITANDSSFMVIGKGSSNDARSNALRLDGLGCLRTAGTITASTTADYAEFFEWIDGNTANEDRVGHFVTLDGNKIRIATDKDDYILGVISGEPFVLGNGDCDVWNGMYLRDKFRRRLLEPAPKTEFVLDDSGNPTGEMKEVLDEAGNVVYEGEREVLNPEYDNTKPYISRADRPEWDAVGMLGVLPVLHDGTAKVNGYVTVNENGIATACEKSHENAYRVIHVNADDVVEIIFR